MTNLVRNIMFIFLVLTSSNLAAYCGTCDAFTGFYLGVNGGVSTNTADAKMNTSLSSPIQLDEEYTSNHKICQLRPWGEVYGGWGWQCCRLYLGGRVGVNFSEFDPINELVTSVTTFGAATERSDNQENRLTTKLRTTEYTFDFKPGVVFCNDTMLFGLIGAALNEQRQCGRVDYLFFDTEDPPDIITAEFDLSQKKHTVGIRGGLGLERMFCGCLSFNITYVYTYYRKTSASIEELIFNLTNEFSGRFSTRAHRQVTSVGITAYF